MKKNAERFARSDLDLSDYEKERTHCVLGLLTTTTIFRLYQLANQSDLTGVFTLDYVIVIQSN